MCCHIRAGDAAAFLAPAVEFKNYSRNSTRGWGETDITNAHRAPETATHVATGTDGAPGPDPDDDFVPAVWVARGESKKILADKTRSCTTDSYSSALILNNLLVSCSELTQSRGPLRSHM